jgi:GNAT superfamily N-acetyltransferase
MSGQARTVTTYHLEMLDPGAFRPKSCNHPDWRVEQLAPDAEVNRQFYSRVGADWHWTDRLAWSDSQWRAYVCRPELQTWVAYVGADAVGYFELERQPEDHVEIAYFGLLPQFIGGGFGGPLLSAAIRCAWNWGAARVWVHTCTLDHPHALGNYLARGFRVFRVENCEKWVGPPGAR